MPIDHTHDPRTHSWLSSANLVGTDFPIQNLPFGVFRRKGSQNTFRGGVAIGDQVLDLQLLAMSGLLNDAAAPAALACSSDSLNDFMAMGPSAWKALRHGLFGLLEIGTAPTKVHQLKSCLFPQVAVEYKLPSRIGNYTDFYTSIHHARSVGRIVRPDNPLPGNFHWLPIAYHGRASSVVVNGTPFHRPMGQAMPPGGTTPVYGPCRRLDHELELGFYIGGGNPMGQPIPLERAEEHIFGVCLLNDWSARDHQFWEMTPLGPFLGKNFCTSVSPWVVTMDALAPYRAPFIRPEGHPQPLPYLDKHNNRAQGGLDIQLEVRLETWQHRSRGLAPDKISATNFRHQYWTLAQMVTQHTVGGCNLQTGDLIGTGTISGPTAPEAGAMVELSLGGTHDVDLPSTGEQRRFLEDGDAVILRGWCEGPGAVRIGFGECRGEILPALAAQMVP